MAKPALKDLSKSNHGHLRNFKHVEVELKRLRSDLAIREAKADRLRSQASDWKQKCLSAVRDRHVIRCHLAQLASKTLYLFSWIPSAASTTPQTSKRSRPPENELPIKHPRAAKSTRSGLEPVVTTSLKHQVSPIYLMGLSDMQNLRIR